MGVGWGIPEVWGWGGGGLDRFVVDSFAKICFGFPTLSFGNVVFQNIFYGTVVSHGEDSVTFHVYSHRRLREVDENAIHCINRSLSWTLELRNRYSD